MFAGTEYFKSPINRVLKNLPTENDLSSIEAVGFSF